MGAFLFVRVVSENALGWGGWARAVVKIKQAGPSSVGLRGRAAEHGGTSTLAPMPGCQNVSWKQHRTPTDMAVVRVSGTGSHLHFQRPLCPLRRWTPIRAGRDGGLAGP